jgi:hypothetical protein
MPGGGASVGLTGRNRELMPRKKTEVTPQKLPVGKSPCNSSRHQEFSCMIKWGVTGKKFKTAKWCEGCKEHYKDSLPE